MIILAIESSCDETAVALVRDGREVLTDQVFSQADLHAIYGGVVPEIASRSHVEVISQLADRALAVTGLTRGDIDAVAVTCAPGLIGALLVGVNFAKSAALALGVPLIPVHHVRGHIAANYIAYPELKPPFVCLAISGGNTLINQHSDSNRTDEILRDTSKCEFIVVCDNMMTPSARYADILLPDTLGPEADDVTASGGSNGDSAAILPLHKAVEPQWEQRPTWEICRGIARHLGKEEAFTEGKTQLEWIEWCYNETRRKIPSLPDFATFWKTGPAHIHDLPNAGIALEAFRKDPKANPLKTPSGRIEIYSERLANIAKNWVLPKGDVISSIPMFVRTWEMPGDALQKKYPLQCYGYHGHGRIHSTFHNLPALREQFPDEVLVNVLDADARGIRSGDRVRVFNDRGAVELVAKVTPRIIPGVVSIPQGAWYRPVMKDGRRVDVGGNINTLTSLRPSPLAKGNPQHTNLVEVVKA